VRLATAGSPLGLERPILGRVCREHCTDRTEAIFVGSLANIRADELRGYRGIITESHAIEFPRDGLGLPVVHSVRETDHLQPGDVVVLQPANGFVRTLYRPYSPHNALFLTERCNSNCLMCSQPPRDHDDTDYFVETNLELIRLMQPGPSYLGITGGEPTLLRQRLFQILASLRDNLPDTDIHMLTNGRAFAWPDFSRQLAEVAHPRLVLGIPLYSDSALVHDYIVQAKHAFDQTVMGLHALARWRIAIEIRVVLHRLTVPRLPQLAEYIYRNFPFVEHVALMGLEPTGYTPRNREKLWIDPADYQSELEAAVEILSIRGMEVRIYNSQLCVLKPSLWKFARRSISDWKNIYLDECQHCSQLDACGGLFQSAKGMHSDHIQRLSGRGEAATDPTSDVGTSV
jgi:His-Xaa-Ser system radical SAM maturase HxsC